MKKPGNPAGKIVDIIGGAMLLATVLLTMFNVFSDWISGRKFGQIDEFTLAAFVWVVYVGAGELYKSGEHIRVDLLEKILPEKATRILKIFVDVVSLVISAVITYYAVILTGRSVTKFTAVLKIPYCYIDAAIVIGFATLIVYAAQRIADNVRQIKKGKKGDAV